MTDSPSLLTLVLLLGGILPLAAGPFLAQWAEKSQATKTALDAFIAVSLGGIVILHLWPHAFLLAGGWALTGGLVGLLTPFLMHHGPLRSQERKIYPAMVVIAFLGLAVHATLDGVALLSPVLADSEAHHAPGENGHDVASHTEDHGEKDHAHGPEEADHAHGPEEADHAHDHGEAQHHGEEDHAHLPEEESHGEESHGEESHAHGGASSAHNHAQGSAALLALAVILHRLPMGIAVWWLAVPILGKRAAVFLLATIAGATVLGFSIAGRILVDFSMPGIAIFEATIAGMLLHVVMGHEHDHGGHGHGPHDHVHSHDHAHSHGHHEETPWVSALGALVGSGLVVALGQIHPMEQRFAQELSFGEAFAALSFYLAPFFLVGAVLQALLPSLPFAPRRFRAELTFPCLLIAIALLGWQWTLIYFLGVAWALFILRHLILRRTTHSDARSETGRFHLPDVPSRLEQSIHADGIWGLVGIGTAALLEPILRIDPGSAVPEWFSPSLPLETAVSLAAAILLGFFCSRHALFGFIVAFFLLHMDWSPAAVICFLLAGVTARILRVSKVSVKWVFLICLGFVPLILGSGFIPPRAAVDFHGLAETSTSGWQIAALVVTGAALAISLFLRGFRSFLQPIFEVHTEFAEESALER